MGGGWYKTLALRTQALNTQALKLSTSNARSPENFKAHLGIAELWRPSQIFGSFPKLGVPFWGSLEYGLWYLGSMLGPPDLWNPPFTFRKYDNPCCCCLYLLALPGCTYAFESCDVGNLQRQHASAIERRISEFLMSCTQLPSPHSPPRPP